MPLEDSWIDFANIDSSSFSRCLAKCWQCFWGSLHFMESDGGSKGSPELGQEEPSLKLICDLEEKASHHDLMVGS